MTSQTEMSFVDYVRKLRLRCEMIDRNRITLCKKIERDIVGKHLYSQLMKEPGWLAVRFRVRFVLRAGRDKK